MGKYHGGILGGFTGKVGSVSGYGVNQKSIIRKSDNEVKVNNFGSLTSVKGWKDNLGLSFNLIQQQWIDNIYVYLPDYQDFNKKALLKAINYIRNKKSGIYDCESLFVGGIPYLSGYVADYNSVTGVFTQGITVMNESLGSVPPYGILDLVLGLSAPFAINQGYSQSGVDRSLSRNLINAGAPAYCYVQSLITIYGTSNIALCPPKVIRVF